jgi:hypothetical protein
MVLRFRQGGRSIAPFAETNTGVARCARRGITGHSQPPRAPDRATVPAKAGAADVSRW